MANRDKSIGVGQRMAQVRKLAGWTRLDQAGPQDKLARQASVSLSLVRAVEGVPGTAASARRARRPFLPRVRGGRGCPGDQPWPRQDHAMCQLVASSSGRWGGRR